MGDDVETAACELVIQTRTEDETRELGVRLADAVRRGDVMLLGGIFGAGKTTLVQGIAAGLDVREQVTSPSFVIANEYGGRVPVYHVDLYRIEVMDQATIEALDEYFGGDGLCVVEWPAALPDDLTRGAIRIDLRVTGEQARTLTLRAGPEPYRRVFSAWPGRASP